MIRPTGKLSTGTRTPRPVELEVKADGAGVQLVAFDPKHATARTVHVQLRLDDARALLRQLQAACDRAHHAARQAHQRAQAASRADLELERDLARVARTLVPR